MRTLRAWLAGAALAAALGTASAAESALESIKKVEIGKNCEFIVNGKPFLPLMTWLQDPKSYPKLQGLGFNVHCGEADPNAAKAVGCYAITAFNKALVNNEYVFAWIHGDEPDMPQKKPPTPRTSPEAVAAQYKTIKAADPLRPVFMTVTGHFMKEESKYTAEVRAKLYPEFVKGCDVAGFDIYPIYDAANPAALLEVPDGVTQLREFAGTKRPIYEWIETSKGSKWVKPYEKQINVEPKDTRAEVWMILIRGATAVGYFTHAWQPSFREFAPLPEMKTELTRLNGQITRLAPAILADPARAKIEMKLAGGLKCHWKATELEGALYIFAQNIDIGPNPEKLKQFDRISPRGAKAAITVAGLKAGAQIEVVDENRTITAEAGEFADEFAPLAEHIYKFKL